MKIISLNDIIKVLNDYYVKHLNGDKSIKNILFLGYFMIGKNAVIRDWFYNNDIHYTPLTPTLPPVYSANSDGTFSKYGKTYSFSDDRLESLSEKNSAIYVQRINHSCNEGFVNELGKILKTRKYTTCAGKEYDLSDIFGVIATGYIPETNSVCNEFKPLSEMFDTYYVLPKKQEYSNYFREYFEMRLTKADNRLAKHTAEQKLALKIMQYEGFDMIHPDCRDLKNKKDGKKPYFTAKDFLSLIAWSGGDPKKASHLLREQYSDEVVSRILPALSEC